MVGPAVGYPVHGELVVGLGAQLLEPGLVVFVTGALGRLTQAFAQQFEHDGVDGAVAGIEVDGPDQGFHGVGQDRKLRPAP